MPFTHSISLVMGDDFKEFLKSIRNLINDSGSTYDNWSDSYDSYPQVISTTSKGSAEKITTLPELNSLYNGIIEKYYNLRPTITYSNLITKEVNGHHQICIIFTSELSSNMRLDWVYSSNHDVNIETREITLKGENGMIKGVETIDLEFCVLSTKHLKKNGSGTPNLSELMNIYYDILKLINTTSNSNEIVFESKGMQYVPDNRKCKPINLYSD